MAKTPRNRTRRPSPRALPALAAPEPAPETWPRPQEAIPPAPGWQGARLELSRRSTLLVVCTALVAAWGLAVVVGAWVTALTGRPMPDMSAGLAPMLAVIVPQIAAMVTHNRESISRMLTTAVVAR